MPQPIYNLLIILFMIGGIASCATKTPGTLPPESPATAATPALPYPPGQPGQPSVYGFQATPGQPSDAVPYPTAPFSGGPYPTGPGAGGLRSPDGSLAAAPVGADRRGAQAASSGRVVYFAFDSAEIRPEDRPVIEAQARFLSANPGIVAVLEGHTDERGTREYNLALGEQRAEAVRRLMSAYGVAPNQLQTLSYGEERPAVPGQDEGSYAQNRRVEIVY